MSAGLLAFIFSLGLSAWVFTKLQGRTGYGNSQAALKGAGLAFIIAFVVMFTLVHSLFH